MSKNINQTDLVQIFAMAQHAGVAKCYISKELADLRRKPGRTDEENKTLHFLETQDGSKVFAMRFDDSDWVDSHPPLVDEARSISRGPTKSQDGQYTITGGTLLSKGDFIVATRNNLHDLKIHKPSYFESTYLQSDNF